MRALCLVLALAAAAAHAQRPLYRSVGADGRVTYSDQPSGTAEAVKQWTPVSQDAYDYYGGRARADSDERYYLQQQYESYQPRPIVVYDPRGWASRQSPARPGTRFYDPNLPPSQPPSLERRYYYDGR
jgi:hypothetical protein